MSPFERLLVNTLQSWRDLAVRRGLKPRTATVWERQRHNTHLLLRLISFESGEVGVEVEASPASSSSASLEGWIAMPLSHALRLDRRHITGDVGFDEAVALYLENPLSIGNLDQKNRALLLKLVSHHGALIELGRVRLPALSTRNLPASSLSPLIDSLEAFVTSLVSDEPALRKRILELAEADPEPKVRELLRALAQKDPELKLALARKSVTRTLSLPAEAQLEPLLALIGDSSLPIEVRRDGLLSILEHHAFLDPRVFAELVPHLENHKRLFALLANADRGASFATLVDRLVCILGDKVEEPRATFIEQLLRLLWPYRPPHELRMRPQLARILASIARPSTLDLISDLMRTSDDETLELCVETLLRLSMDKSEIIERLGTPHLTRMQPKLPLLVSKVGRGGELLAELYADLPTPHLKSLYLKHLCMLGDSRFERLVATELESDDDTLRKTAISGLGQCGSGGETARARGHRAHRRAPCPPRAWRALPRE